ncbi:MAG TPA: glutathione S-transferase family protein [Stellaceae bacterium]|nr:glutathione S-transferase family protein [Stellaceae bacterium]
MGVLVEGEWRDVWYETEKSGGAFERPTTRFRRWITADGSSGFPAAAGRYHLFLALACPWCHRTLLFRLLKRLENVISVSFVEPLMLENGWTFAAPEPITGARYVYQIYQRADPRYSGRATVPVLWDKATGTIVSNESADIIRMLNRAFDGFTEAREDYYPAALAGEIDALNARIYDTVNNGVYKAGFATQQEPYAAAVRALFETLDWLEERLGTRRYLLGERLTEADWRLFPTLVRFDAVYYGHFKCNLRHVYEYPALWDYTRALYQRPGVAATVDLENFKTHYYGSQRRVNPSGVVPLGPRIDFTVPATRR